MNKVLHGDCLELMKNILDGSIDMTMTSPPYDNLRTYNGSLEWGEHIWKPIIKELYRVTKQGGVVVWIVGDATVKGSETGTSFRQALFFKEVGFNIHDTMIYQKAVCAFPDSRRYYQNFEFMFILSKGAVKTFNPLKDRENKTQGRTVSGTQRRKDGLTSKKPCFGNIIQPFGVRFNVWAIAEGVRQNAHPAQFPLQLAHDHIISWSNEGDVILDPFAGSGTTGIACLNTNRKYILMEKDEKYFEIIENRIKKHKLEKQNELNFEV